MRKILYVHPFGPWPRGHAHKIFGIIKKMYGGTILTTRKMYDFGPLRKEVAETKPDLLVVSGQNHPFWKWAKYLGIPYILVEHDVITMLPNIKHPDEKPMIENAEAVIFVSEDHIGYCHKKYRLPPYEVVYLRPLMCDLAFSPLPKLPGKNLVFTGSLMPRNNRRGRYGHKALHNIFDAFLGFGWQVHLYCPHMIPSDDYSGCILHETIPQGQQLYQELSQYTAGFHGSNAEGIPEESYQYVLMARANKTWEYLAAGIPTLGYNPGKSGEFYNGKWGTVLESLEDIPNVCLPEITEDIRYGQTIEQDMKRVRRLLDPVINS